jgi:hypothetical protein
MTDDAEYFKMLKRMLFRAGERAGDGDEIELRLMSETSQAATFALDCAVLQQLKNGKSFAEVGKALKVSKQYLHKKYSHLLKNGI